MVVAAMQQSASLTKAPPRIIDAVPRPDSYAAAGVDAWCFIKLTTGRTLSVGHIAGRRKVVRCRRQNTSHRSKRSTDSDIAEAS